MALMDRINCCKLEGRATVPEKMMQMLADHVPVTLLLDLFAPPNAQELFSAEGGEADWLANLNRSAA
jgi:hypothetical protein